MHCRKMSDFFRKKQIRILLLAIVLLMGVVLGVSIAHTHAAYSSRIVNLRMENIGELVTQAAYFTNVQVISDAREVFGVTVPFTQSKYVFSYDGVIRAGVNFAEIDYCINSENRTITISVPKPYIMSTMIYEDSLEIYNESKNIFTPLTMNDLQESRQKLIEEAETQAVANGLLEEAAINARVIIESFFLSNDALGNYEIIWITTETEE